METRITTAFFTSDILPKQNRSRNLSTKILFCESNSIFMYQREMLFSVLRCLFADGLASFWNQPTVGLQANA